MEGEAATTAAAAAGAGDDDDFHLSPTQKLTQQSQPHRNGSRYFELSGDDATDIFCFLHPATKSAFYAVAMAQTYAPHMLFHRDISGDSQDLEYVAEANTEETQKAMPPPPKKNVQAIALRLSHKPKDPELGWTFGRNRDKCDFPLIVTDDFKRISNCQFRIKINKEAIPMLYDTSTNGTILDDKHLRSKGLGCDVSQMLTNGCMIQIPTNPRTGDAMSFLVRLPTAGSDDKLEAARMARLMEHAQQQHQHATPASVLMGGLGRQTYGMHWNGGDRYNVIGKLGRGAFAIVYKIATKQEGKVFAAKELDKQRYARTNADVRIDNELRIMKELTHPNIVQYMEFFEHQRYMYIIMEYVPCGELSTWIVAKKKLPEHLAKTLSRQTMHALDYLHRKNVTHRDIKPDNILIYSEDPFIVKLSDFGLSKTVVDESFLKTFCGTLLYCAPEVYPDYGSYLGSELRKRRRNQPPSRTIPYSDKVDIWSFGAVLFHLLCLHPPFMGTGDNRGAQMLHNIMTRAADFELLYDEGVSSTGVEFVDMLLQRDPNLRPSEQQCLAHRWIRDVEDIFDYEPYDNSTSPAVFHLAAIQELDEADGLDASQLSIQDLPAPDTDLGPTTTPTPLHISQGGDETVSKRQRIDNGSVLPQDQDLPRTPAEVNYPALPEISPIQLTPETVFNTPRLFGEILADKLQQSSEVLPELIPPPGYQAHRSTSEIASSQSGEYSYGDDSMEDILLNLDVSMAGAEPDTGAILESQTLARSPALQGPAPSLLGTEALVDQMKMDSPSEERINPGSNTVEGQQNFQNTSHSNAVLATQQAIVVPAAEGTEEVEQTAPETIDVQMNNDVNNGGINYDEENILEQPHKDSSILVATSIVSQNDQSFSQQPASDEIAGNSAVDARNSRPGRRPSPVEYYQPFDPSTHNLEYASRVSGHDFVAEYASRRREQSPARTTRSDSRSTGYRSRPGVSEYRGDPRRRMNMPISPSLYYDPHNRATQNLEYASKVSGHDFVSEYAAKNRAATITSQSEYPDTAVTIDEKTGQAVRPSSAHSAISGSDIIIVAQGGEGVGQAGSPPSNSGSSINAPSPVSETPEFVRPQPRYGRVFTTPGSVISECIRLTERWTSWGRHPNARIQWKDPTNTCIPKIAFEIAFWAPGIEKKEREGFDWTKVENPSVIVSTKTTACIWVNGVPLRFKSSDGMSSLFGKLYTGDVITVYENKDKFIKFECQFNHGRAIARRPEAEKPFQIFAVKD